MAQSNQNTDMPNLIHRLKARLALANFKREHGYENIDLRTLESPLYNYNNSNSPNMIRTALSISKTSPTVSHSHFEKRINKKRKLSPHHRFYPTSPPMQHNDIDRLIKKNASRSPVNVPLSETRLQNSLYKSINHSSDNRRKLSATALSSDDEDAAHLLVLMHHSPTMTS